MTNPCWGNCITSLKRNLIAATCIASMLGTFCMALVARMPLAVAPAMVGPQNAPPPPVETLFWNGIVLLARNALLLNAH